jgi:hypothetical protein
MFGTIQRRSVTATGRFRSSRLRNLVSSVVSYDLGYIGLEEKTLLRLSVSPTRPLLT